MVNCGGGSPEAELLADLQGVGESVARCGLGVGGICKSCVGGCGDESVDSCARCLAHVDELQAHTGAGVGSSHLGLDAVGVGDGREANQQGVASQPGGTGLYIASG